MLVRGDSLTWLWTNSHHITGHRGWTKTCIYCGSWTTIEWPLYFHTASGRLWNLTSYRSLIISLFWWSFQLEVNWESVHRQQEEKKMRKNRAVPRVLSCRYQRKIRSSKTSNLCFKLLPFWFESSWLFYTDSQVYFPFIWISHFPAFFVRFRALCNQIINHKLFDHIVLVIIFLNCITIAMERPRIDPTSAVSLKGTSIFSPLS